MKNVEWIIVGLGNPEERYLNNRHNIGFICVDRLASKHSIAINESKFDSLIGYGKIGDASCMLVKPQTYMNKSGEAVAQIIKALGLHLTDLIVIADDISLSIGSLRIRLSGRSGGHKGLNSIIESLGSIDFARVKIGAGIPPESVALEKWVVSDFEDKMAPLLFEVIENACKAIELMVDGKCDVAMSRYNHINKE